MIKIAILGAMKEEIEPLLSFFDNIKQTSFGNNTYYEVNYKGISIVIAYSKIGKVFSALTASIMIQKFKCNQLLFSGVAGGLNPNLKIGDLILATSLCQHDIDITAFGHDYGYVPEGKKFISSDKNLLKIANKVSINNNIKIFEGIIATGDQFINSNEKKEFIYNTFKADAIEMEGASVALVCDSLNIPFLILRSISDTANMDASFDFDSFLINSANKSALYLTKIVEEVIKN